MDIYMGYQHQYPSMPRIAILAILFLFLMIWGVSAETPGSVRLIGPAQAYWNELGPFEVTSLTREFWESQGPIETISPTRAFWESQGPFEVTSLTREFWESQGLF